MIPRSRLPRRALGGAGTGRRGARCRTAAVLATAALFAASAAGSLPRAGDEWIEVETTSFLLVSNAGERKTVDIGLALERFRSVLATVKPGARFQAPVPTRILVFRNERSFAPYRIAGRDSTNIVGYFLSHPHGNTIALNAAPRRGSWKPVIFHEFVHYYLRYNLPHLPLWANEGLAEYFSTFEVIGDEARIGAPPVDHVVRLRRRSFIPFEILSAVDPSSPEYNETEKKGIFYAQSWALIHYLQSLEAEQPGSAAGFFAALQQGMDADEALSTSLGLAPADLETKLRGYVNGPSFRVLTVEVSEIEAPDAFEVRPVTRSEVLTVLGELLAVAGEPDGEEARRHFEAALAEEDPVADARAGLAMVAASRGDRAAARRLFAEAIEAGSSSAATHVRYADLLLEELRTGIGAGPQAEASPLWREARQVLLRARELDPNFAEIDALLGATYFYDAEHAADGVPLLREAVQAFPERAEIAYNLVLLLLKVGRTDEAAAIVDGVLSRAGPEMVGQTREAVERSRLIDASNAATESGDVARGIELFRQAIEITSDARLAEVMTQQLDQLVEQHAENEKIDRYNRAVGLANAGRLDDAYEILEALLVELEEGEMIRLQAERLALEIERAQGRDDR